MATSPTLVVFNGYRSRMDRYFAGWDLCPLELIYIANWRARDVDSVELPGGDLILCGWSDGGLAAHAVAQFRTQVKALVVHSSLWYPTMDGHERFPLAEPLRTDFPVQLFRTRGDRTPTYNKTSRAHAWYRKYWQPDQYLSMETLAPLDDQQPFKFLKHEFLNCVESLRSFVNQFINSEL